MAWDTRYRYTKTIDALLEASKNMETLCMLDLENGPAYMHTWKKILAEAVEEVESNIGKYVRRLRE